MKTMALADAELVEVFALRKLRPRRAGGARVVSMPQNTEGLRRCTRRWFSRRENHHLPMKL